MIKRVLLAVLVVAAGYYAYERFLVSEEGRIRKTLEKAVDQFQKKDLPGCLAHVSPRYQDEWGFSAFQVRGVLARVFQEFKGLDLTVEDLEIQVLERREATVFAGVRLLVTRGDRRGFLLGSGDRPLPVKIHLAKERGRWRITEVSGVRIDFNEDLSRTV
jgi:hypothetical protein